MAHRLSILAVLTLSGSLAGVSAAQESYSTSASRAASSPRLGDGSNPAPFINISKLPKTVEVNLTASVATLSLQPGVKSEVFAYNGQTPGPTLDVREGDHVIVHFKNDLPEPTTVHWHGIHLPFDSDGSPYHPIAPGKRHDYVFTVPVGTAGTYWYHPHPNHRTGYAIGKGLYGGIIIRPPAAPIMSPLHLLLLVVARIPTVELVLRVALRPR